MHKSKLIISISFISGLILYLCGLFLLFGASLNKLHIFSSYELSSNTINIMKIIGIILFMIGFLIFMVSVIYLYKNNEIKENVKDLIIEGKADVITIIVMTYIMIFMIVICLIFDQIIGALLFGITILLGSIINNILIKYFSIKN